MVKTVGQTVGVACCSGLGPRPPGSHAGCTSDKPAQPRRPPPRPLRGEGSGLAGACPGGVAVAITCISLLGRP